MGGRYSSHSHFETVHESSGCQKIAHAPLAQPRRPARLGELQADAPASAAQRAMGGRPATARIHMFETVHESSGCQKVAHAPLAQPRLPARLGELQADSPAGAAQRAMRVRPGRALIYIFETVHESSGCQKIAHAPLAQPRLPARLGKLQADAPASAAQRAKGGRPATARIHMFETVHESSGCQKVAHAPLAQPRLPARLGELQADAPASAAQRAMGVRPGRALIHMFETVHESSGCQKIAHVPLAQPRLPARLGELQADAPASAAQRAKGGRPAAARNHMFETVHESSGCQKIAHVPFAQPRLPARLGGLQADAPASAAQRAMGGRPGRALVNMLKTVYESSGCQKIAHVPLAQPRRPARLGGLQADAPASAAQRAMGGPTRALNRRLSMSLQGARIAHVPLAQPRLPARLGELQADAPASAAQRAMGVRPGRALIHMFETVHESSGCQKIAHVPLAQPRRPARLGGLQADAPASAAQRANGGADPLQLAFTCSRLSMSLQGARRLLMCRLRSHAFLRV